MQVNLKNVTVGWLNVFEKADDRTNSEGKLVPGKYQATIYLDKKDPQIRTLDEVVRKVVTEGLKDADAADKWIRKNYGFGNHADKCAIKDLAERDKPVEGFETGIYFKAAGHKQPKILTSEGEKQTKKGLTAIRNEDGEIEQVEIEGKEVYSGCKANVSVDVYWYGKHKVLMVDLWGLKFREDGSAFGGAHGSASDDDLADDDDAPKSKRLSHDDEDEKPTRRRSRDVEDEDDEDERPRRRRNRDED